MFDSMNEDISPKIDFQLADDIMHTGNWIEAKVTAHLRHYGLTYIQFNTLNVLKKSVSQPMSVGELKDNTSFLNTDITRLVDRLVKKKLVNRNLSPTNRRKMEIMLSKKGVVLLQKINAEVKILIKDLFNNLSEEDTPPKAVLNLFKKVIL